MEEKEPKLPESTPQNPVDEPLTLPVEPTPAEAEPPRLTLRFPRQKPIVVYTLLGITILIYALQMASQHFLGTDLLLAYGAKFGPLISAGQVWRLFTPVLLHGSLLHLAFNMYALFIIGRDLEPSWGHLNFLIFYLITGFGGNVFSYVFSPRTVSVGASTALFGMIAAQGFLVYRNRKFFKNYRKAIQSTIYVVVINLMIGMQSGIDNWGHLGGLVSGTIIAFLCSPVFDLRISEDKRALELYDTTKTSRRMLAYTLTFLFFAALAFAFR